MSGRDELALLGGTPVRSLGWPSWPIYDERERRALMAALEGREWGGFPMPNVHARRFAEAFAQAHDCRFGQCVANGTVSLEIGLQAMGIEPGAEVLVPAYTFEATAAAVLFAGCVPVFVDVDPDTYCLDVAAANAAVSERTQAILPVHLAMTVADLNGILDLAGRHGLGVLEDCAHAHGAQWRGRGVGSTTQGASFSFQTSKLMTAGEGGIVITNDERILDGLFALTNCGRQRPGRARDVPVIGHNYRMTDLQAALLEVQLERMEEQQATRVESAALLVRRLKEIDGIEPLQVDERVTRQAIYQFVLRYDSEAHAGVHRDAFVAALTAEGVPCDGAFYEALHQSRLFPMDSARYPIWQERRQRDHCPVAERAAYHESVWLPHQLLLAPSEVEQIAEAVHKVCRRIDGLRGVDHPEIRRLEEARALRSS